MSNLLGLLIFIDIWVNFYVIAFIINRHSIHYLFHIKTLLITHSLLMKPDEGAPSAVTPPINTLHEDEGMKANIYLS